MDVCFVIQQRLKELGLEQRDLAAAAQVTESYISQLLTRKKAPPAAERTDLYERMNAFLRLPKGQLSAMVEAQRREELQKKLADPPLPLFKEVRSLIIRKCKPERQIQLQEIFEKQAFGELERLVTQTLLDVSKSVARAQLKNEERMLDEAKLRRQSYEELRAGILDFLDTDVFNISMDHCNVFLDPLIESWDIDLKTFGMEIAVNRGRASTEFVKFEFIETKSVVSREEESGFQEFQSNEAMSGNVRAEELEFLRGLRFGQKQPTALYYYRELQSLRDPLHFHGNLATMMPKRRDPDDRKKHMQAESRKKAMRRWARNQSPSKQDKPK